MDFERKRMSASITIGSLDLTIPRVVGTVSDAAALVALTATPPTDCDLVEIRLDRMDPPPPVWLNQAQAIERTGRPVLLTLRTSREGGDWHNPDLDRLPILTAALSTLAAVDIETDSACYAPLCALAESLDKTIVASFHDFVATPPLAQLLRRVAAVRQSPRAIPKIAVMVRDSDDVATLSALLQQTAADGPICVIGMGPAGAQTRIDFPRQGSCLAYGFLDRPAAPGQWSAAELRQRLRPPATS